MNTAKQLFQPEYSRSPGKFLDAKLLAAGISKADLARRCGRPLKTISEILGGSLAITPDTALQFEKVLDVPASRWLQLETAYRLHKAKSQELHDLGGHFQWAKNFPLKDLSLRGYLTRSDDKTVVVESLLKFLGVANAAAWEDYAREHYAPALFKRSTAFQTKEQSILAWLRIGEIEAQNIHCNPYDAKAFRSALADIRCLIGGELSEVENPMRRLCAEAGVALVIVKDLPKGHVSGAARWVSKDKAVLQLSNRTNRDDVFWFSFYHEAAHILLHGKKEVFIDEEDYADSQEELEANEFAGRTLLPKRFWTDFHSSPPLKGEKTYSHERIKRYAEAYGVSPGIVVGQLIHHDHLKPGRGFERLFRQMCPKT